MSYSVITSSGVQLVYDTVSLQYAVLPGVFSNLIQSNAITLARAFNLHGLETSSSSGTLILNPNSGQNVDVSVNTYAKPNFLYVQAGTTYSTVGIGGKPTGLDGASPTVLEISGNSVAKNVLLSGISVLSASSTAASFSSISANGGSVTNIFTSTITGSGTSTLTGVIVTNESVSNLTVTNSTTTISNIVSLTATNATINGIANIASLIMASGTLTAATIPTLTVSTIANIQALNVTSSTVLSGSLTVNNASSFVKSTRPGKFTLNADDSLSGADSPYVLTLAVATTTNRPTAPTAYLTIDDDASYSNPAAYLADIFRSGHAGLQSGSSSYAFYTSASSSTAVPSGLGALKIRVSGKPFYIPIYASPPV